MWIHQSLLDKGLILPYFAAPFFSTLSVTFIPSPLDWCILLVTQNLPYQRREELKISCLKKGPLRQIVIEHSTNLICSPWNILRRIWYNIFWWDVDILNNFSNRFHGLHLLCCCVHKDMLNWNLRGL